MYTSIAKYGVGALITTLSTSKIIEYKMKNGDEEIQPPVDKVTIIIPSYNEEKLIEECLKSLRDQSIVHKYPEYFEYLLVDSQSTDNTVALSKPYVDKVIIAPRGKLTARMKATDESKGNIIVSVDSDSIYLYTWLNTLLKPFKNPKIAGVVGSSITYSSIPSSIAILTSTLERTLLRPTQMVGRNSAYWKHLYYSSGKFNTNINQRDIKQMIQEEEVNFGKRLSKYGNILFKLNATCIHLGGEKGDCRAGFKSGIECNKYKIGIERFDGNKGEYYT